MHKVNLKKPPVALKFANFFGFFGYLFTLLEWLWIAGLLLVPIASSGQLDFLMPAKNPTPTPPLFTEPVVPEGLAVFIGIVVTVICLGIMAYAFYTIPKTVGKTGSKITHSTAKAIAPAVVHHKKFTKKQFVIITFHITSSLKIILASLPVATAYLVPQFESLPKNIVIAIALVLSAAALFNFGVQIIIAKTNKLNTEQVW